MALCAPRHVLPGLGGSGTAQHVVAPLLWSTEAVDEWQRCSELSPPGKPLFTRLPELIPATSEARLPPQVCPWQT